MNESGLEMLIITTKIPKYLQDFELVKQEIGKHTHAQSNRAG